MSKGGEKKWTQAEASLIQSTEARKNNGKIEKGSLAAKAQSAAAKNEKAEGGKKKTEWTEERASCVQSAEAKKNDGKIEKGSHPAKAQSAAAKNENKKAET